MTDSTPLINDSRQKQGKLGHRVLCCCDSRKAVILINLFALVLIVAGLIAAAVNNTFDSDTSAIIGYVISVLFYLIVMFSALQYHRCAVIVAIIWNLIVIVWTSVGLVMERETLFAKNQNQTDIIIYFTVFYVIHVFVIYAEWVYVSEVGKGIMSRETHSREKYSCCCNV
mmetsp:Transcript_5542/g.7774  ORF Transcript_5542/g.7774 Transcript_5542/m.7774 type:complete len:170 (+) Transcript_5542:113-622(+)